MPRKFVFFTGMVVLLAMILAACGGTATSSLGSTTRNTTGSDIDGDGINDDVDNCPTIANANQTDAITPDNGIGDACDDPDGDTVYDLADNCPAVANPSQRDSNGDGEGDVCDTDSDTDNDGSVDASDNCPMNPNRNQRDSNGDGEGDVCDTNSDSDGDGTNDDNDECPSISDTSCRAISTVANLTTMITDNPNGYFRLADDMTINTSWTPIASFAATLDGDNYTISNLSAPLFGTIAGGGIVTQIGIIGEALASGNEGTISYSYATGNHSCGIDDCAIGGLVGQNFGTITNAYALANSTCNGDPCFSGGLVGVNSGTITTSYAIGDSSCSGSQCFSGGLVGHNIALLATIANSYATGDSVCRGTGCASGGLVGSNDNSITNSYATGNSSGAASGGLVGQSSGGTVAASYRAQGGGVDGGSGDINRTFAQLQCPTYPGERCLGEETYTGWDNTTVWNFGNNRTLPALIGSPACPNFRPNCRH